VSVAEPHYCQGFAMWLLEELRLEVENYGFAGVTKVVGEWRVEDLTTFFTEAHTPHQMMVSDIFSSSRVVSRGDSNHNRVKPGDCVSV